MRVTSLRLDEKEVESAAKGDVISLKVETKVRRNDMVYILTTES
jgi:hypothetical protein